MALVEGEEMSFAIAFARRPNGGLEVVVEVEGNHLLFAIGMMKVGGGRKGVERAGSRIGIGIDIAMMGVMIRLRSLVVVERKEVVIDTSEMVAISMCSAGPL